MHTCRCENHNRYHSKENLYIQLGLLSLMGFPRTYNGEVEQIVQLLLFPEKRDEALIWLVERGVDFPDLGLILWHSFGTITVFMQEIVCVYKELPTLTRKDFERVCNVLRLLNCVASHSQTRAPLIDSLIVSYLYVFIDPWLIGSEGYEILQLVSLEIIASLLKVKNTSFVIGLMDNRIIPICLRVINYSKENSREFAMYILYEIILYDVGLEDVCATAQNFHLVTRAFEKLLCTKPSPHNTSHILKSYLRLSQDLRARLVLREELPYNFLIACYEQFFRDDQEHTACLNQLMKILFSQK